MFTILNKNFNGRVTNRYFKSWENAKNALLEDVTNCCEHLKGEITLNLDYFNQSKGFYVFEQEARFENGETCHWALIDQPFEDE
jgi:hypothetical protein